MNCFLVPFKNLEFNKLPFRLSNRLSSFQWFMDVFLKNLVGMYCWFFIDGVIIFSKSAQKHAHWLESVLQRFDKASLQFHPGKCVFVQPQVQYLEFVLSAFGISALAGEVKAVRDYPAPRNIKDFRAFLGLALFYSILVLDFAEAVKPLTEFTRKDWQFIWGPSQQKAFEDMKDRLCTTPVLAYLNFDLPFILKTDASKVMLATIFS